MRFNPCGAGYEFKVEAQCGEPFDCFFAFAWWRGSLWSAHRRHIMFEPDDWPDTFDDYVSDIVLTQWREDDAGNLVPQQSRLIGRGNDPRICAAGDRLFVLYRKAIHAEREYYLYEAASERLLCLATVEDWFKFGKNWVPFERDGDLYAVHGFAPYKLLLIDTDTGFVATVQSAAQPFEPRAAHDRFNMLRGGTNPLTIDGTLVGLGHATMETWRHYPFVWRATAQGQLEIELNQDFTTLADAGFGIIDPTSLHKDGTGNLWIGICASERDWFYDQSFLNLLMPARLDQGKADSPTVRVQADAWTSRRFVRRLMATDLPTRVQWEPALYSGRSTTETGFLVFGPYEPLAAGEYRVTIRYKAEIDLSRDAGWSDMCACGTGGVSSLCRITLAGTDGKIVRQSMTVQWRPEAREVFEVRVHCDGGGKLTVYDIELAAGDDLA